MTLQVATPPDIDTVSLRPSHWSGPKPLTAKDTDPVGAAVPDGTPITFALNVGELEPTSVAIDNVVLELALDAAPAGAAGNESHTTATGARARTAPSAGTPRRNICDCVIRPC